MKLFEYHDVLKCSYYKIKDKYIQRYNKSLPTSTNIKVVDIRTLGVSEGSKEFIKKLQEILTEWQSYFSLEKGIVCSIGYIYGYSDNTARIYFALHHLIVDAISWRVLSEDLQTLYNGGVLGNKGSSYRQWTEIVKKYPKVHKNEHKYWKNILADYDVNQYNRLNNLIVRNEDHYNSKLQLNQAKTEQLLQKVNVVYNTEINDILLTSLSYALFEITGEIVNHIVLEGHGREEIDSTVDITRTVGWFTTMYPVKLEVKSDIASSIKHIKYILRQIPNKGIGYGAIIGYDKSKPLPKISFNYLGQFDKIKDNKLIINDGKWTITNEASGQSRHKSNLDNNIININGLIINQTLQFNINSQLGEEMTNKFALLFKSKLEQIINHTVSQNRTYMTIDDVDHIISQENLDDLQVKKEIDSVYLANSLQQGFIYHTLNQGDVDDAYIVQVVWEYNNQLDTAKLKQAWEYTQKKYSSLRLRLSWKEELIQIIEKQGTLDWRYIDLSDQQDDDITQLKIQKIQERDRVELYNLEEGSLFRVYLIKQKEDLYSCIFSYHHAILDGWSNPILFKYVHDIYSKLVNNMKVEVAIDYSYEHAQSYLQNHRDDDIKYWRRYIGQIEERSDLSALLSEESRSNNIKISEYKHILKPKEEGLIIKAKLYNKLKSLGQKEGVTLNAILQYVWHKILSVYNNSNQTFVGTVVSGRNIRVNNIENSVGLYINTLPLIINHESSKNQNILDLIKVVQSSINEINMRSNISLSKLQDKGRRLFDSLFIYENYPIQLKEEDKFKIKFKKSIEKLDYPLAMVAYERNHELILKINYAGELFAQQRIKEIFAVAIRLLEQIALNSDKKVSDLNYMSDIEQKKIIYKCNTTDSEYPNNKTIQQLFEEQVEKTPDSIVMVCEEKQISYRVLNERANQLAHYLVMKHKIQLGELVILYLDRSEYILIAILAILKAGGAYVPMDPSYPDDRIKYILKDTKAKIVLTNSIYKEKLSKIEINHKITTQLSIVVIDNSSYKEAILEQSINNPVSFATTTTSLAYVIYTSGTTGNPKGVMVEHNGVINLKYCLTKRYKLSNKETILLFANYVFDASVEEIILTILNGHKLIIANKQLLMDTDYFNRQNVTHISMPPTLLSNYDFNKITALKRIDFGGEKLKKSDYEKIKLKKDHIQIINSYGPTEASITSTTNIIKDGDLSIGMPIDNRKVYILDNNLKILPIGAIGELYLGGVGLARGYLNKTKMTAEKFIKNPFQSEVDKDLKKNDRLYKTGDLVRLLPDGSIEYIGRNDFQIKLHGYRIELEEIENMLSSYEGIKQSIALLKEYTSFGTVRKYLIAYYVSDVEFDFKIIKDYLLSRLPEYMVPNVFVHLEKLPLTINGKLDRKALPIPNFSNEDDYIAPRNELEKKICLIWSELLGLPAKKIGVRDDFFRLGGNSIMSIHLLNKLRLNLQLEVSIKEIYEYKTIEKFTFHLNNKSTKELKGTRYVL